MSEMIRTGSPARFTPARLGRLAVLAVFVLVSACSGSDAVDPLASAPGFAKQLTSLATPAPTVTVAGSTVTVSWPAVADANEYHVVVSSVLSSKQTTTTSVVYTNVPDGAYTAKVRAEQTPSNNGSNWSGDIAFTVATAVVTPAPAGDNTPPVITYSVGGTVFNGWYTTDVTVDWTVTDAQSTISSNTCVDFSITADQQATTYTCSATSAGGTSSNSVTIKRDATVPVVGFSGNAGSYTVDQTVSITCSADDATSGIASQTCPSASGAAYTFNIGSSNLLSASATDNAGNANSASASFTVSVTAGSLCNLTRWFVSQVGIANSLCVKLNAAEAAALRGNLAAKAGPLNAYVKEVQAQTGKSISAGNAAILIRLAGLL